MADGGERQRQRIEKGDKVRFREGKVALYAQIYDVDIDQVFEVAHVEPRGGKRALYLARPGRENWIPAYPSALILVLRRPEPAEKPADVL